jgi:hypothetical protein
MADVPIYVAVISALAAILGASVTPLTSAAISAREARVKRREDHASQVRAESVSLLRAAWDLRTMTQNNHEYHGAKMAKRLAKVRERAADAAVRSATIALLSPGPLASAAAELSGAAQRLAASAAATTNLDMGVSTDAPNLAGLDLRIAEFETATAKYFGEQP